MKRTQLAASQTVSWALRKYSRYVGVDGEGEFSAFVRDVIANYNRELARLNGESKATVTEFDVKCASAYCRLFDRWTAETGGAKAVQTPKIIRDMREIDGVTEQALRQMWQYLSWRGPAGPYQNRVHSLRALREKFNKLIAEAKTASSESAPKKQTDARELFREIENQFG